MRFKKVTSVAAASALALGLAACGSESGSGSNNAQGGGGDNYVLANGSEPQNPLIPGNTNETGGGRIVENIFSGLVYYDGEGNAHNELAESIDLEGDKTTA